MHLQSIATSLMKLVDGTDFKVEYSREYVSLWTHGAEHLEHFMFSVRGSNEYHIDTFSKVKSYIEKYKEQKAEVV